MMFDCFFYLCTLGFFAMILWFYCEVFRYMLMYVLERYIKKDYYYRQPLIIVMLRQGRLV